MNILIVILIFVAVYAFAKFLFSKIETFKEYAEILGIIVGAIAALIYAGVVR